MINENQKVLIGLAILSLACIYLFYLNFLRNEENTKLQAQINDINLRVKPMSQFVEMAVNSPNGLVADVSRLVPNVHKLEVEQSNINMRLNELNNGKKMSNIPQNNSNIKEVELSLNSLVDGSFAEINNIDDDFVTESEAGIETNNENDEDELNLDIKLEENEGEKDNGDDLELDIETNNENDEDELNLDIKLEENEGEKDNGEDLELDIETNNENDEDELNLDIKLEEKDEEEDLELDIDLEEKKDNGEDLELDIDLEEKKDNGEDLELDIDLGENDGDDELDINSSDLELSDSEDKNIDVSVNKNKEVYNKMNDEILNNSTVKELKLMAKTMGLSGRGNKDNLIERIKSVTASSKK